MQYHSVSVTFPTTRKSMEPVSEEDYREFINSRDTVVVENVEIKLVKRWGIQRFGPDTYSPEVSTVWSFPTRGSWASHSGSYRGNWSPLVPRNLMDHYTQVGDLVCDPMVGSGTTLVEAKLMGRNAIGVDINRSACMVAMNRLDFEYDHASRGSHDCQIKVYQGDARNLDKIPTESVDLVATHPPYWNIISYSNGQVSGDLSGMELVDFVQEIGNVASECFRILKSGKFCAILIGDTRRHSHYVPIHIGVLNKFLDAGFVLCEEIIKLQHMTKSGRERWAGHSYNFFKIAHEHLYVLRKPDKNEETSELRLSMRWW